MLGINIVSPLFAKLAIVEDIAPVPPGVAIIFLFNEELISLKKNLSILALKLSLPLKD